MGVEDNWVKKEVDKRTSDAASSDLDKINDALKSNWSNESNQSNQSNNANPLTSAFVNNSDNTNNYSSIAQEPMSSSSNISVSNSSDMADMVNSNVVDNSMVGQSGVEQNVVGQKGVDQDVVGQIVYGSFDEVMLRKKAEQKVEIGELLIVEITSDRDNDMVTEKVLFQVVDLQYSSQLSSQTLELIAGLQLDLQEQVT